MACVLTESAEKENGQYGHGYVYTNTRPSEQGFNIQWDDNGYLIFCLCMGAWQFDILVCLIQ